MDWDRVREMLKKIDKRSLAITIIIVSILAGLMLPQQPADLTEDVGQAKLDIIGIKATVGSISQRVGILEQTNVAGEVAATQANVANVKQEVAQLKKELISFNNSLAQRLTALETGITGSTGIDIVSLRAALETLREDTSIRLNALEVALDDYLDDNTGETEGEVNIIDYTFDTDCQFHPVHGATWYGEQFKTGNKRLEVTKLRLYLSRTGSPTEGVIRLYSTGISGLPATQLWYETVDASGWSTSGKWKTFSPSDVILPSNSLFVLAVSNSAGNASNVINFGYESLGSYPDGGIVGTLNGGSSWTVSAGPDMLFEVWGVLLD